MASYFESEEINIIDKKGLEAFLKMWVKQFPEQAYLVTDNMYDGKTLTFEEWNDWKIISYWYDEMVVFLECIAKYIEGYVKWNFETDDEAEEVIFQDGKATIKVGTMIWSNYSPAKIISAKGKFMKDEDRKLEKFDKIRTINKVM